MGRAGSDSDRIILFYYYFLSDLNPIRINSGKKNLDPYLIWSGHGSTDRYSLWRISVRRSLQGNHNDCGKSKYEFWCMRLFITVKSEPLIDDLTAKNKKTAHAELFQLRGWWEFTGQPDPCKIINYLLIIFYNFKLLNIN
jgi:hypothetical protein